MYADPETLRQLAQGIQVVYQKTAIKATDDYLIDHSAGTYVYDPKGNLRLLMPYGSSPDAIAQDLRTLLALLDPNRPARLLRAEINSTKPSNT